MVETAPRSANVLQSIAQGTESAFEVAGGSLRAFELDPPYLLAREETCFNRRENLRRYLGAPVLLITYLPKVCVQLSGISNRSLFKWREASGYSVVQTLMSHPLHCGRFLLFHFRPFFPTFRFLPLEITFVTYSSSPIPNSPQRG